MRSSLINATYINNKNLKQQNKCKKNVIFTAQIWLQAKKIQIIKTVGYLASNGLNAKNCREFFRSGSLVTGESDR